MKSSSFIFSRPLLGLNQLLSFLLWVLVSATGACQKDQGPPIPRSVDEQQARILADAAAQDLLQDNSQDLYGRMDPMFQTIVQDQTNLEKVLQQMYKKFGKVQSVQIKAGIKGHRMDVQVTRPSITYWYAVETTLYPMGKYFLKVEVIPALSKPNCGISGFGMVTFTKDEPSYLR